MFVNINTIFFSDISARGSESHRSTGHKHQSGRARPSWDLEEGLPVSVVQDCRRGRLRPAVPKRRSICRSYGKRKCWRCDSDFDSFYCSLCCILHDNRCLCGWVRRAPLSWCCKSEAFTGSTDRQWYRPSPKPDCSAVAGGRKSKPETLNCEQSQTSPGRSGFQLHYEPFRSALEQDTESLPAAGVLLCSST